MWGTHRENRFISYSHTNSPRALAARIFAYQQLHSSGVKLPPVGSLKAANVVSCVEHLVNRDGAQNPSTALKAGTCRMCPPPLYAQVILLTFDSAPVFLPLRPFQLCRWPQSRLLGPIGLGAVIGAEFFTPGAISHVRPVRLVETGSALEHLSIDV